MKYNVLLLNNYTFFVKEVENDQWAESLGIP